LIFLTLFVLLLVSPQTSHAASANIFSSPDSFVVKAVETVEYFFAFKVEQKVQVLEKHAEKRLLMAQDYIEEKDNQGIENMIQNYQQIKERQNNLLGKTEDGDVLGTVAHQTVQQQRVMEEIKTGTDEDTKQKVIRVQEQVVNQVAKRVIDANGPEGATEFLNEVVHVWAPGTGPGGGEAGVVIEGGQMRFAPGTSGGGSGGADIKTIEIKTGGGGENTVEGGSGGGLAPGTTQDGGTPNTIDPGGVDPGDPGTFAD
jgi:hypothetical protein